MNRSGLVSCFASIDSCILLTKAADVDVTHDIAIHTVSSGEGTVFPGVFISPSIAACYKEDNGRKETTKRDISVNEERDFHERNSKQSEQKKGK